LNFERRQECRLDERTFQPDGVLLGEITIRSAGDEGSHGRKRSLRFLPINLIRSEHELNRFERRFVPKADQPIVVRIGKAPE
jgi:hypothetical protein